MTTRALATPETIWWRHVTPTAEGCWIWQGSRTTTGYGHAHIGGRAGRDERSHRLTWKVHNGPIPAGMCVLHHCDVKPCCRPDHLYLGTKADNARDMQLRMHRVGEKLTPDLVRQIRSARAAGARTGDLERLYGVSDTTILDVVSRKSWRHVA